MLIQFSVVNFIAMMEQDNFGRSNQARFNQRINQMFEGVRDYVVAHYQLNTRIDSDYWRENRRHKNISDRLASIFEVWDKGGDFEAELTRNGDALMYQRPSWYCILAGMGRFPAKLQTAAGKAICKVQARAATAEIAKNFYGHRAYLKNS
jgi:hypothetical protein